MGRSRKENTNTVSDLLKKKLHEPDFHFYRTTSTDSEVCRELILELGRRGVRLPLPDPPNDYKTGNDEVALIAEWDTFYGRALPLTFASVVSEASLDRIIKSYPKNIHTFRYLRGIDGMLPEASIKDVKPKGDAKEMTYPLLARETTEGLNQADYLRRLAGNLQDLNQQLIKKRGEGLRAVGVLGSDVYDKLLILKALRRTLPGTLFFTNSLDARLGHPDEWQSARNLIVVSPFGLQLTEKWKRKPMDVSQLGQILPFRDSYQTAVYASTLLATGDEVKLTPKTLDSLTKPPRLYEIARSGPYELSREYAKVREGSHIHPLQSSQWWNGKRRALALAMGLFVGLLAAWIYFVLIGKPKNVFSKVPSKEDPRRARLSRSNTSWKLLRN